MSAPAAADRLFDIAPTISDVEDLVGDNERRRDQLAGEVAACDRELRRLRALAHALRELVDDPSAAAVAGRLAEHGWSGTGEELVTSARGVAAQARCS